MTRREKTHLPTMSISRTSETSNMTKISLCEKYYGRTSKTLLDQFADDTKMLGFRYLHSRYQKWFRIMWSIFLFFALTLTIYQVVERISYYLLKNPLTSKRSFENLNEITFPTIVICNKMQIKSSKVASLDPKLLNFMVSMFDEENKDEDREKIMENIKNFDNINILEIYKYSHQSIEDFIVSCQYGRKKQCIDNVNIIFTPNGICFKISPNITVLRAGPESTLSLLLNLETYDIIPGMVPEPGVILSIYDSNYTVKRLYDDGVHLEGGKLVTIPINDIRSLERHPSECSSNDNGNKIENYSKQECEWKKRSKNIEKNCNCSNLITPKKRKYFNNISDNLINSRINNISLPDCTLEKEYNCVNKINNIKDIEDEECLEDCIDIRFNTIVFGNELDLTEVSKLLPVNWEDEKEKKIKEFFKGIDLIPKERIPIIRSIQKLSDEGKEFVNKIKEILDEFKYINIINGVNTRNISYCDSVKNPNVLMTIFRDINNEERIWGSYKIYYDYVLKPNIEWLLKIFESNEKEIDYENGVLEIDLLEKSLNSPEKLFGLKSIPMKERELIINYVINLIKSTKDCYNDWKKDINKNETINFSLKCKKTFNKSLNPLKIGREISEIITTTKIVDNFFNMIKNVSIIINDVVGVNGAEIFKYKNYDIDIHKFRNNYGEDGKELGIIYELLKHRKLFQSDISQKSAEIINDIKNLIKYREEFFINNNKINNRKEILFLNNSIECFTNFSNNLQSLKKIGFLRSDWIIRLQREVTTTQSYSSGPEFDKVNLLHVKLYFTHIKRESIINVRSYNIFLLLAEIGGTIGLYVGATLLTVAETIVFLFENHVKSKNCVLKNNINIDDF
uniref:Amiloride-sensitive sodium channel subunit alpha n=1 Tax=Parastrongyloides trichosuri TaxID=131310 RepID=A0A0N4ZR62_PARTI